MEDVETEPAWYDDLLTVALHKADKRKNDDRVQEMIIEKTLSAGHARALLAIESKDAQFKAAEKMVADGMSVRDAEDYVKKLLSEKKAPLKKESKNEAAINRAYARYEEKLKQALGTKVTIAGKPGNKGKIEIAYYSLDEFERILELLGISL